MKTFGLRSAIKNKFYNPNKEALFIFGFAKSGTSAIASLLGEKTGKSVTIDTRYLWEPYRSKLLSREITMKEHVEQFSYPFSKQIIKEPSATFLIKELKEYFHLNQYIFIVRNPFDNIRSILNRLDLPGSKDRIDINQVNKNWQHLFIGTAGEDYVRVLSHKWIAAYNQKKYLESKSCILVRYEDFNSNKESYINQLSIQIGSKPEKSISHLVNKEYQPKGDSSVDLYKFFGAKNYKIIYQTCKEYIKYFDYK